MLLPFGSRVFRKLELTKFGSVPQSRPSVFWYTKNVIYLCHALNVMLPVWLKAVGIGKVVNLLNECLFGEM